MNTTTKKEHYTIAGGVTNRVGDDRYFLVLDFDGVSVEKIEEEVADLQRQHGLADASFYRTRSGYHVFFLNDNRLSGKQFLDIVSGTSLVDRNFVTTSEEMVSEGEGVTIRLAGKYETNDIVYSHALPGTRKPSILEKNLGTSISEGIKAYVREPLIDHSEFRLEVDPSGGPGKEIKTPVLPSREKASDSIVTQAEEVFDSFGQGHGNDAGAAEEVEPETEKASGNEKFQTLEEACPENPKITDLRKKWYRGNMSKSIARLICSSTEGRELALNKMPSCSMVKDADFQERRPFFFNNSASMDAMLKPYEYVLEATRYDELPYNFFQSHARYDRSGVPNVPLMDFKKQSDLRAWLRENGSFLVAETDVIFDIDCKDPESTASYVHARKLRDALKSMRLPFSINFSGSKGFHVRIPADEVTKAAPELAEYLKKGDPHYSKGFKAFADFLKMDTKKRDKYGSGGNPNAEKFFRGLKHFAKEIGVEVDEKAYSGGIRSQIRVLWSVHPATGSVVKPLTDRELDALDGKTLRQIQEAYRADNLLSGNKETGTEKLNLQKNEFTVRMQPDGSQEWMSWEEMRDSGNFDGVTDGKKEWEWYRASYANHVAKDLRAIAKENPKELAAILEKGEHDGFMVEAPEYVDLVTGRNHDYRRKGSDGALRSFLKGIIPDAFND